MNTGQTGSKPPPKSIYLDHAAICMEQIFEALKSLEDSQLKKAHNKKTRPYRCTVLTVLIKKYLCFWKF
ncbi:MAG: hypothetical protein GY874_19690 [Desulfobacteraceae bacterium]|nr:hypothetical protein [Desulfobacteraceae bacterium]